MNQSLSIPMSDLVCHRKTHVRDAGTGDVTRAEFGVHIDSPPEIGGIDLPDEIYEDFPLLPSMFQIPNH